MTKNSPVLNFIYFGVFLVVGIFFGTMMGPKNIEAPDSKEILPATQVVQLQPEPSLLTPSIEQILFIGVDQIETQPSLVLSAWMVARGDTSGSFTAKAIYPTKSSSVSLKNKFINVYSTNQADLRDLAVSLGEDMTPNTGVIVLDRAGFAFLLACLQGGEIDYWLVLIAEMTNPFTDPEQAYKDQRNILQVPLRLIQDHANKTSLSALASTMFMDDSQHFYTDLGLDWLIEETLSLQGKTLEVYFLDDE